MPKKKLKKHIREIKGERCHFSNQPLPADHSLYDTHRLTPKRMGGTYTDENTTLCVPVAHMEEHGNIKNRPGTLNDLKVLFDDFSQWLKLEVKINNQLKAAKRETDTLSVETKTDLEETLKDVTRKLGKRRRKITKWIRQHTEEFPIVEKALEVTGLGEITIAFMLVYLDFNVARHPAAFRKYCGYHVPSHERYVKGESGGGNKTLRTKLYAWATWQLIHNGPYKYIYENTRRRLDQCTNLVKSYNTEGKLIECMWKDTKPGHRQGAGIRKMIQHLLFDWWYVGRLCLGLPVGPCYAEGKLGDVHKTDMPCNRGWKYDDLEQKSYDKNQQST